PLLRLLESQLQEQRREHEEEMEALRNQVDAMQEEVEKQQQAFLQSLQLSPEIQVEFGLQREITRLTNENLVRGSAGNTGRGEKSNAWIILDLQAPLSCSFLLTASETMLPEERRPHDHNMQVAVQRKEKEFQGMLEYHKEDEPLLIQNLII
ncbi:MYO5B protein, partial [Calyptomena viridis]|nr:MYO5B protein [Calyptomena viridis]